MIALTIISIVAVGLILFIIAFNSVKSDLESSDNR